MLALGLHGDDRLVLFDDAGECLGFIKLVHVYSPTHVKLGLELDEDVRVVRERILTDEQQKKMLQWVKERKR